MKFTIAINTCNLSIKQQKHLHQALIKDNFNNKIVSSKKDTYQLPHGWYVIYGFYKITEISNKVKTCLSFLPNPPEVLITESVGRIWSNLPPQASTEK
jgi:hypothetical protein